MAWTFDSSLPMLVQWLIDAFVHTDWEQRRQVDYQNQQKAEQEWAAEGKKPAMKVHSGLLSQTAGMSMRTK